MSLVPCRECGVRVSTSAVTCPQCGVPSPANAAGNCLACGQAIEISPGAACPRCGIENPPTPLRPRPKSGTANSSSPTPLPPNVLRLGVAGPLLLLLGAFLPILRVPFVGAQNYVQNGQGDGMLIVALAVVSLLLVLAKKPRWLIGTGGLAGLLVGMTFLRLLSALNEMERSVEQELAGNPFRGLADVALQGVGLEWGWVVLFAGVVTTLAAGAIHQDVNTA